MNPDLIKRYSRLADFYDMLANPSYQELLKFLHQKPARFTDIMWKLKRNPKLISVNLKRLTKYSLIEKDGKQNYGLTEYGYRVVTADYSDLRQIVNLAMHLVLFD